MALFLGGYIDLRFGDEVSFNLEPTVPYGWIRIGQQRGIPSRKGGNLNVFGLLNVVGQLTTYQTTQSINSQTIINYLDDFSAHLTKLTVLVLDNAPWHTSEAVRANLSHWQARGLFVFYLPPYSPHLNLIETLWRKMKLEWLQPQDFEHKESLHQAINTILNNYNNSPFNIDFSVKASC